MKSYLFQGLKRASGWYGGLEKLTLVTLMVFLIGFALLQIVLRNFFETGFVWGDTLLRHVVLWVCFLGAARATAQNRHIHIDLLPRLLAPRGRLVMSVIGDLFSMIVSAVLFYASCRFVLDERASSGLAFGGVPYWWLELIFPFSFALIAVRFGARIKRTLMNASDGVTP
jgi:TRAP-type C4-dicarboxylate transport system permease small subunit